MVKVDYNMQAEECDKFVRLAVMVDLNKLLRLAVMVDLNKFVRLAAISFVKNGNEEDDYEENLNVNHGSGGKMYKIVTLKLDDVVTSIELQSGEGSQPLIEGDCIG
ncbi:hypothetical protein V6N12_073971 [Hibiscus sabdariffa]|uniref:Uncharacterized protein n=1 Tax=Hibiscus sabdariffa TaxID=183260 RepID=A0ABR2AXM2_9ROSI